MIRMSRHIRRLVLTIHVVVSVGWIGIEAGLLALGLNGLFNRNPDLFRAYYVAIGILYCIFVIKVSIRAIIIV